MYFREIDGKQWPMFEFGEFYDIQDQTCETLDRRAFDYVAAANHWKEIVGDTELRVEDKVFTFPHAQTEKEAEDVFYLVMDLFFDDHLNWYLMNAFIAMLQAGNGPGGSHDARH